MFPWGLIIWICKTALSFEKHCFTFFFPLISDYFIEVGWGGREGPSVFFANALACAFLYKYVYIYNYIYIYILIHIPH